MRKATLILVLLLGVAALSGCSINIASALVDPTANLSKIKSLHILKREGDTRNIDLIISKKASERGFAITSGVVPPLPVDAVLTYHDRWFWDITMFMPDLSILIREPESNYILASGYSLHGSITRKSPDEMAEEVLGSIFGNKGAPNAHD